MKKNLILVRHATAEEPGYSVVLRDYDRELISKGIMESAKIGNYLKENFTGIEAIYSSGAARAMGTAKYIAEQIGFGTEKIELKEALYGSGPRGYLEILNLIPKGLNNVMIVGHNPDVTYFADYLTENDMAGHVKKGMALQIEFEGLEWNEIIQHSGILKLKVDPKTL